MNSPEDRLDHVLTGLRDAPVPAGLERRMLQSLQRCSESQARTSFLGFRIWAGSLPTLATATPIRLAAASAIVGFVLSAGYMAFPHPPALAPLPSRAAAVTTTMALRDGATSSAPAQRPGLDLHPPENQSRLLLQARNQGRNARAIAPTPVRDLATLETLAPSLAPPPLPLTADERRMQTAVRHSQLPQLAELHVPDPPPTGLAPLFAGFAARSAADPQISNAGLDTGQAASPTLNEDNQ